MVFYAQDYLDKEYLNIQQIVHNLCPSTPVCDPKKYKDEVQLLKALVSQNKQFGKQIVDLMETMHKESLQKSASKGTSNDDKERSSYKSSKKSEPSEDVNLIHLQRKIEYLNNLVMESKQTLEEKDFEISQLKSRLQTLSEEYSSMFSEKEKGDQDLQELIVEYSSFRDKMDKLTASKDNQINEMKRKLELRGISNGREGNENIPERDELLEELREKLESKEKTINDLRARLDRQDTVGSQRSSSSDMSALYDKISQLGIKLEDYYLMFTQICRKVGVRIDDSDKPLLKTLDFEDLTLDRILKIVSQDYYKILESLRVYSDRILDKLNEKSEGFESSMGESRSPPKNRLRDNMSSISSEIQEKLRSTSYALERSSKEELWSQLQTEMEKNGDLQNRIDFYTKLIHKINFIVQEEVERLTWVYEYSSKLQSIHEFRNQLDNCKRKLAELLDKSNIAPAPLSSEYAKQKSQWEEQMSQSSNAFNQELAKVKAQLENERNVHERAYERYKAERERLITEFNESEKVYKAEVDRMLKRCNELESENNDIRQEINQLQVVNSLQEKTIHEREEALIKYTENLNQWQKKCSNLENESLKNLNLANKSKLQLSEKERQCDLLENEIQKLEERSRYTITEKERELDLLKNEARKTEEKLKNYLNDRERELEYAKNDIRRLDDKSKQLASDKERESEQMRSEIRKLEDDKAKAKDNIEKYQSRIRDLELALEYERSILKESNEELARDYKNYVDESERNTKEIKDGYEKLISEYTSKIQDLGSHNEQQKKNHLQQMKQKSDEIQQLTSTQRHLEENIRGKEDRISDLAEELRAMNSKNQALESAVSEFHSIKEKNKKYFDLLTTTNNDLNNMKIELQNVLHEKNDIQAKNTLIEREYNTIREELRKYQEKFNESSDAIEQFKSEVKMLKHELDIAHEKLAMKLKESKENEENLLTQSQNQLSYKDEVINQLKTENKHLNSDYELVKQEYQRTIERNEEILVENRRLRGIIQNTKISTPEKKSILGSDFRSEVLNTNTNTEPRETVSSQSKYRDRDLELLLSKSEKSQK